MENKKTSVFAILSILQEESDADHILSQPQLIQKLENQYGIKIDRRTLYTNIEMLQDFGYDISTFSDNGKGYYLCERQFEPSQVNVLCNAIHSSSFIPPKSSKDLIDKLLGTQSKYFKEDSKYFYALAKVCDNIRRYWLVRATRSSPGRFRWHNACSSAKYKHRSISRGFWQN